MRKRGETSRALRYIPSCPFRNAYSSVMFVSKLERFMYCHSDTSSFVIFFSKFPSFRIVEQRARANIKV